jgi:hypothetical protein
MAIDNELSSEIAAALLTGKHREPHELRDLKEMIIKVHTTLQNLSAESRRNRILLKVAKETERAH